MTETTLARVTGILNVSVPVTDHDRALGFYRDLLGLEVRRDATFGPGMRWVEVAPEGAQSAVALAPVRGGAVAGVDSGIRLGTPDAASMHQLLSSKGVDVDADLLRIPSVPPMFGFRDPDGNTLYFVETAG